MRFSLTSRFEKDSLAADGFDIVQFVLSLQRQCEYELCRSSRNKHRSKSCWDLQSRARDLFYGLWVNDLFMQRVEANQEWSLFCPNEAPGLADVWGAEFSMKYEEYERQGRAKKTIRAQQLWFAILEAQARTLYLICISPPLFDAPITYLSSLLLVSETSLNHSNEAVVHNRPNDSERASFRIFSGLAQ